MAKQKVIPKRSEVDPKYTWALEDIFATDELWEDALNEARSYPEKLAAFVGHLGDSAQMLYDFLQLGDEMNVKLTRLAEYCMRKSDEDTGNSFYQGMKGRFMNLYMQIAGASSFSTPEILAMPDGRIEEFMNEMS